MSPGTVPKTICCTLSGDAANHSTSRWTNFVLLPPVCSHQRLIILLASWFSGIGMGVLLADVSASVLRLAMLRR